MKKMATSPASIQKTPVPHPHLPTKAPTTPLPSNLPLSNLAPLTLKLSSPLHCGYALTQTFHPLASLNLCSVSHQQQSRSRFLNNLLSPLFHGSSFLPLLCHHLPTSFKRWPPAPLVTNKLGGWLLLASSLVHIWEGKLLYFSHLMAALITISFQKGSKESSREVRASYCEEGRQP